MRLAWFSPWPPQRSGIAGRSAELVPLLAARGHAIDVFVDAKFVRAEAASAGPPEPGRVRMLSAHEFLWRQPRAQYDLPVYQIGNSHLHRYIWPYLFRHPGLAVLHDGRVHHARAEALLSREREDDYRAEFAWNHPGVPPGAAELAILGFGGTFFYQWPMVRSVLAASRLTAAHSTGVAAQLAEDWPEYPVTHIALGEGATALNAEVARMDFRFRHGLDADTVVFGVHGGLTQEKCIRETLSAFAATLAWLPRARLLLVGAEDSLVSVRSLIRKFRINSSVIHVPVADDDQFNRSIAACDVTINLRWPSALETSGPWVRSLSLGKPTITIAAPHQAHVPALDPLSWQPLHPAADLQPGAADRAVTVALDLLSLEHSLRVAMHRLGEDAELRTRLGRQARLWWEREHTVERMVLDYERAFARAGECAVPAGEGPAHLRPDPPDSTRALLGAPAWSDPGVWDRLSGVVS